MYTRWLCAITCLALFACGVDPSDDPSDMGTSADRGSQLPDDASTHTGADMARPPDGATPEPDMAIPDAAPPEPDAGIDPCVTACDDFVQCSIEHCEGYSEADQGALTATCLTTCTENPAFAVVASGANGDCSVLVDFGRTQGDDDYNTACNERMLPPEDDTCPWDCQDGETCRGGHCLRDDQTCDTDYHCIFGVEVCLEGQCQPAQFAECRSDQDCAPNMDCRSFSQDPLAPGNCIIPCQANADCPIHESCRADFGNICYYDACGPGTNNGTVYGECVVGGEFPGTCYPSPEGNRTAAGLPGFCLEGGDVPLGESCDSGANERTEGSRALQCAAGGLCFGDPDDARDPSLPDNRGNCSSLCDPRAPMCGEDSTCLDYSSADDPATPNYDDTRFLGICNPSDCDLFNPEPACADGQACRFLSIRNTEGQCGPVGDVEADGACETADDCAGVAFCSDEGVCLQMCDPDVMGSCGPNRLCFRQEDRWVVGFCIADPNPQPVGDMGVEGDAQPIDAQAPDVGPDAQQIDAGIQPDAHQ